MSTEHAIASKSATRGRPRGSKYRAYRVFLMLLYGQFSWISRSNDGILRVGTTDLVQHSRIKADDLKRLVDQASDWGLVNSVRWYRGWFECKVAVPPGMAISLNSQTIISEA